MQQADVKSKFEDRERRRQEVRESLMAQTKKKGFMTPERKKALKVCIICNNFNCFQFLKQQNQKMLCSKDNILVLFDLKI